MQEGRTDGDIFPDNESEEAGQGQLEEAEKTAWVSKPNDKISTDSACRFRKRDKVVGGRIVCSK